MKHTTFILIAAAFSSPLYAMNKADEGSSADSFVIKANQTLKIERPFDEPEYKNPHHKNEYGEGENKSSEKSSSSQEESLEKNSQDNNVPIGNVQPIVQPVRFHPLFGTHPKDEIDELLNSRQIVVQGKVYGLGFSNSVLRAYNDPNNTVVTKESIKEVFEKIQRDGGNDRIVSFDIGYAEGEVFYEVSSRSSAPFGGNGISFGSNGLFGGKR